MAVFVGVRYGTTIWRLALFRKSILYSVEKFNTCGKSGRKQSIDRFRPQILVPQRTRELENYETYDIS